MKTPKSILLLIAVVSLGLLGVALYLQFVEKMLPCPLCILQRYAFIAVALICFASAFASDNTKRYGAGLGMLAALSGAGVASWHLWVKAHPAISCGIDPLETSLNKIFTAKLLPFLLQADGLCTTEYAPIMTLSIPQWSLVWFLIFAIALGWIAFKRKR